MEKVVGQAEIPDKTPCMLELPIIPYYQKVLADGFIGRGAVCVMALFIYLS